MSERFNTDDYEIIPHSKLKHMHSFIIDITYRNFHLHSDYELMLVLDGKGTVRIRDSVYELSRMDSIIINQNEIHEIEGISDSFIVLLIQFSRHFCADYFPTLRNTTFNTRLLREKYTPAEYRDFVNSMLQFNYCFLKEDPLYSLSCTELLLSILHSLYTHTEITIINENQYRESKKKTARLNRISTYIGSNYLYPIRLKDLADMEGITVTHMSHIFTENFGITFQQYLISKRIEEAVRLSQNSKMSAAKVSELSGFSDPKYLNKAFVQKFGCSYKEFIVNNIIPAQKITASSKIIFEKYLSYQESLDIHKSLTTDCL